MRRTIFWLGWAIVIVLPVVFSVQAYMIQDIPPTLWYGVALVVASALIYFGRNRDDVLRHHLA